MENFIVSARKFRPQTFASVVGQSHITQTLKNAIARGQLAHAYLFTGPRGVGKTSCARIFAKAINCLNPAPDNEACGVCESCVAFSKDRSFNIHELDAASNNSVDDMRALTDKVRIAPQIGKYSIYIIDEVHMLSAAAFNAFLKTLEEPPHYAIFILATTEKHKILPTILSRCQIYDFNRIRVEDMVGYLKYIASQQGVEYDEESLHIIAQKADGGMRDALSTFDRVVSFCGNRLSAAEVAESIGSLDLNTYFRATELALGENFAELLLLLDTILKKGFDAQIFIAGMCEHLRNLLVAKNPQTATLLEGTKAVGAQYTTQAQAADYDFLFNAINLLTQADTTYKASTNRRLHAELALIKLCALKKKEPIAERYPMPAISIAAQELSTPVKSDQSQPTESAQGIKQSPQPAAQHSPVEQRPDHVMIPDQMQHNVAVTAPTPVPQSRRSITGLSLGAVKRNDGSSEPMPMDDSAAESPVPDTAIYSPQQTEQIIRDKYGSLIELWHKKCRPRIASALEVCRISGSEITIAVPDEVQQDEFNQAKNEIERDIYELTDGVRASLTIIIKFVEQAYRPITIEQKYQYLADINPSILKLHKRLDLTI